MSVVQVICMPIIKKKKRERERERKGVKTIKANNFRTLHIQYYDLATWKSMVY